MSSERLQKLLAQAGVASRRAAEVLIAEGRVRVNGRVVTVLGTKADPHKDKIEVDGRRVVAEKPAYYLLHKPREVVTTLDDPEGRQTIAALLRGIEERVFPVGRLDYHTSGVLLVTNDGAMAQALLHPRKSVPKTYVVKVKGHLTVPDLDRLRNGVDIGNGETTRKAEVFVLREEGANTWLQMTITEGKNRQIHRMMEATGRRVARLARVAFAGLTVDGLRPGDYRPLGGTELQKLKRDYLNPSKRAHAEAAHQAALEQAMADMGYGQPDDDPDEGEAPPPARPTVRPAPARPERPLSRPRKARTDTRKTLDQRPPGRRKPDARSERTDSGRTADKEGSPRAKRTRRPTPEVIRRRSQKVDED